MAKHQLVTPGEWKMKRRFTVIFVAEQDSLQNNMIDASAMESQVRESINSEDYDLDIKSVRMVVEDWDPAIGMYVVES